MSACLAVVVTEPHQALFAGFLAIIFLRSCLRRICCFWRGAGGRLWDMWADAMQGLQRTLLSHTCRLTHSNSSASSSSGGGEKGRGQARVRSGSGRGEEGRGGLWRVYLADVEDGTTCVYVCLRVGGRDTDYTTTVLGRSMSCVPGYFEVINTHTAGFLTIPRACIKWV